MKNWLIVLSEMSLIDLSSLKAVSADKQANYRIVKKTLPLGLWPAGFLGICGFRLHDHAVAATLFVLIFYLGGCAVDQTELAWNAIEAKDYDIGLAAVNKVTDQTQLKRIDMEAKHKYVSQAAAGRVTDQTQLAQIAVDAKDEYVREVVINKLTDRKLLAKIAVEDKSERIRLVAHVTEDDRRMAEQKYTFIVLYYSFGAWMFYWMARNIRGN